MMDEIAVVVGLLLSIGATIISITSFYHTKRSLYVSSITQSRFAYMKEITSLLSIFIDAYIDGNKGLAKATVYKINLYLNLQNPAHKKESIILDKCIKEQYSDENAVELISQSQLLFTNIFEQIKFESYNKSAIKKMRFHYKD